MLMFLPSGEDLWLKNFLEEKLVEGGRVGIKGLNSSPVLRRGQQWVSKDERVHTYTYSHTHPMPCLPDH